MSLGTVKRSFACAPFSGLVPRVGSFNENVERHSLHRASVIIPDPRSLIPDP
jgi:hypothetical protein